MKIYIDCMPCFIRQALDSARLVTDDEITQEQIVRYVLAMAADMDTRQSPPAIGQKIHRLIRQLTNNDDPYKELKKKNNSLALRIFSELEQKINSSQDPLETAVGWQLQEILSIWE